MQLNNLNLFGLQHRGQSAVIVTGSLDPEPDHRRIRCIFGAGHLT